MARKKRWYRSGNSEEFFSKLRLRLRHLKIERDQLKLSLAALLVGDVQPAVRSQIQEVERKLRALRDEIFETNKKITLRDKRQKRRPPQGNAFEVLLT
jgi:hypothetical protein